jgi:hypothetical protein
MKICARLALCVLLAGSAGCRMCQSPFDYCASVIGPCGTPNCDWGARAGSVYHPQDEGTPATKPRRGPTLAPTTAPAQPSQPPQQPPESPTKSSGGGSSGFNFQLDPPSEVSMR